MITSLDLESRAIILVSPATICPFNRCLYFLIAISINISNTGIDFNSPVLQKQRLLMILLITATITDSIGTPMFLLIVQQLLSKSSSHCSGKDVYLRTRTFYLYIFSFRIPSETVWGLSLSEISPARLFRHTVSFVGSLWSQKLDLIFVGPNQFQMFSDSTILPSPSSSFRISK